MGFHLNGKVAPKVLHDIHVLNAKRRKRVFVREADAKEAAKTSMFEHTMTSKYLDVTVEITKFTPKTVKQPAVHIQEAVRSFEKYMSSGCIVHPKWNSCGSNRKGALQISHFFLLETFNHC